MLWSLRRKQRARHSRQPVQRLLVPSLAPQTGRWLLPPLLLLLGVLSALLAWGRALLQPRPIDNLHRLGIELGADMAAQIELLNTSLYAKSATAWSGDELLRLCQQLEQQQSEREPRAGELQPLNPVA